MDDRQFARYTLPFGFALLGLAVSFAIWGPLIGTSDSIPRTRPTYESDAAREKAAFEVHTGNTGREKERELREQLLADVERLTDLPPAYVNAQYFGPSSLAQAVERASGGVAVATVVKQELGEGYVVSHMRLDRQLRGETPGAFVVWQVGGPGEGADGTRVAVQLEADPLLVPGLSYVVLLGQCGTAVEPVSANMFCTGGANGGQFQLNADNSLHSRAPEGLWARQYNHLPLNRLLEDLATVP